MNCHEGRTGARAGIVSLSRPPTDKPLLLATAVVCGHTLVEFLDSKPPGVLYKMKKSKRGKSENRLFCRGPGTLTGDTSAAAVSSCIEAVTARWTPEPHRRSVPWLFRAYCGRQGEEGPEEEGVVLSADCSLDTFSGHVCPLHDNEPMRTKVQAPEESCPAAASGPGTHSSFT